MKSLLNELFITFLLILAIANSCKKAIKSDCGCDSDNYSEAIQQQAILAYKIENNQKVWRLYPPEYVNGSIVICNIKSSLISAFTDTASSGKGIPIIYSGKKRMSCQANTQPLYNDPQLDNIISYVTIDSIRHM